VLRHHDEDLKVTVEEPVTLAVPPPPHVGEVEQPPGRAPLFRRHS
jgi:alpha,alpha-trehalose phosphorylase